jgi:ubiquinone/menaquinone biosynthesis C-methylase UbiE
MNMMRLWRIGNHHFRSKRMAEFEGLFGLTDKTRILDVGGTAYNWQFVNAKPTVTLLNVTLEHLKNEPIDPKQFTAVIGDATALQMPDRAFDVAYSNSVIEHVGTLEKQRAFAQEIRRVASRYYVQTPYKWFPIEPHLIAPFIHWLPPSIYRRLVRWFSVRGWMEKPNQAQIDEWVQEFQLLDAKTMRELFPDGELRRERFLGFTKSLIVFKA